MASEQQDELGQLVASVLKRDVLFVLYHLQRLQHGSINQLDSLHHLSPLKAALSLSHPCPRRSLILEILLLSGASDSSNTPPADSRFFQSAAPRDYMSSLDDARNAKMLLQDLTIQQAEVWLRDNGLDVEAVCGTVVAPTSPSPLLGDEEPRRLTVRSELDSNHVAALTSPSIDPFRLVEQISGPPPSPPRSTSPHTSRTGSPQLAPPPPLMCSAFTVHDLGVTATSIDVRVLLNRFLHHSLVMSIIMRPGAEGHDVFDACLHEPTPSASILKLNGFKWKGQAVRVSLGAPPLRHPAPSPDSSSLSATRRASKPQRSSEQTRTRSRSSSPARDRRGQQPNTASVTSPTLYAYGRACRPNRDPAPRWTADQRELDAWAERSFVNRWAPDYPGFRPLWVPERGNVWRGQLCPWFPPREYSGQHPCWGRDCDNAHDPAELRNPDGSLVDPQAAADLARRHWTISGRS